MMAPNRTVNELCHCILILGQTLRRGQCGLDDPAIGKLRLIFNERTCNGQTD